MPVSPDGTGYQFHARSGVVVNDRHGSLSQPTLHPRLDERAVLGKLLEQLKTIRVELRFREDGVHITLTINRGKP